MAEEPPNGTEPPRRRAQKKMTAADKEALVAILKRPDCRVNGKIDVSSAARLAGLTYQQVYYFMRGDPYWRAQVTEANPDNLVPKEETLIDSDLPPALPPGITLTNGQFEEYQALLRQNRKMMQADWERLGMTAEAGKRMEHYIGLGAAPTGMILRATTGQLISNMELLDRMVKADFERVLSSNLPKELDGNGDPRDEQEVEREWRHTVYTGVELQLKMFAHVHKVQALMARVMKDLANMPGAGAGAKANKGVYDRAAHATPVSERDAT